MKARKPLKLAPRPDLQTQLESLLDQVWRSEASWRLDDRIALAFKVSSAARRKPNA